MFLNNIPMIIGSLLLGLSYNAHSYEMLIAGRFVIGVACGMYDMSVTNTIDSNVSKPHIMIFDENEIFTEINF